MPFYEYRPKSGKCEICHGRFADLQSMSAEPHKNCPDCGKACERVLSAPMVSFRGAEFRDAANAEKRAESFRRASSENLKLRSETRQKIEGHTHDCAAAGCLGERVRAEALGDNTSGASSDAAGEPDLSSADRPGVSRKLPHLVK
jgi:putative FmdB family regulatory protein